MSDGGLLLPLLLSANSTLTNPAIFAKINSNSVMNQRSIIKLRPTANRPDLFVG